MRTEQQLAADNAMQSLKWLDSGATGIADGNTGDVGKKLVTDTTFGGKKRGEKALGRESQSSGNSRERDTWCVSASSPGTRPLTGEYFPSWAYASTTEDEPPDIRGCWAEYSVYRWREAMISEGCGRASSEVERLVIPFAACYFRRLAVSTAKLLV